jgi:hypothetical protein
LFRDFQMLRVLLLPGTPVAQRPLRWFRHILKMRKMID